MRSHKMFLALAVWLVASQSAFNGISASECGPIDIDHTTSTGSVRTPVAPTLTDEQEAALEVLASAAAGCVSPKGEIVANEKSFTLNNEEFGSAASHLAAAFSHIHETSICGCTVSWPDGLRVQLVAGH